MHRESEIGPTAIRIAYHDSPAGKMLVGSQGDKLCICDWVSEKRRTVIDNRMRRYLNAIYEEGSSETISKVKEQLDEYFSGQRTEFSVTTQFAGTDFQCKVWSELEKIPYGETLTYARLAERIGCPRSVRAVASAVGANPISIVVPCHRIIGRDNSLTGYGGGLEAKLYLLDLEAGIKGKMLKFV